MKLIDRFLCNFGWCRKCRLHENADGIGGRCESCGRIHGWMTSAELRAVADRRLEEKS